MKKGYVIVVLLMILLLCCGCQSSEPETWDGPPGFDPVYSITEEFIADSTAGIYKMVDHQGTLWFDRITARSWKQPVAQEVKSESIWHQNYLYLLGDGSDEYNFVLQTVTRGSEQMVIVGGTGVRCTPILEMGYTIPYIVDVSDKERLHIGSMVRGVWEEFEEINGKDPMQFADRLSSYSSIVRAQRGEQFAFGYYSGTKYVEEAIAAQFFYYIIGDYNSYTHLPVTETKNGYFLVDCSALEPGYYCFSFDDRYTVIEVR